MSYWTYATDRRVWLIAVEVAGEGAVEDAFGEGGFGGGSDAAAEAAFGEGFGAECGLGFGLVVVGERGGIGESEELEAREAFGAGAAVAGEKRGALIGGGQVKQQRRWSGGDRSGARDEGKRAIRPGRAGKLVLEVRPGEFADAEDGRFGDERAGARFEVADVADVRAERAPAEGEDAVGDLGDARSAGQIGKRYRAGAATDAAMGKQKHREPTPAGEVFDGLEGTCRVAVGGEIGNVVEDEDARRFGLELGEDRVLDVNPEPAFAGVRGAEKGVERRAEKAF